jgi:hypothetical protein
MTEPNLAYDSRKPDFLLQPAYGDYRQAHPSVQPLVMMGADPRQFMAFQPEQLQFGMGPPSSSAHPPGGIWYGYPPPSASNRGYAPTQPVPSPLQHSPLPALVDVSGTSSVGKRSRKSVSPKKRASRSTGSSSKKSPSRRREKDGKTANSSKLDKARKLAQADLASWQKQHGNEPINVQNIMLEMKELKEKARQSEVKLDKILRLEEGRTGTVAAASAPEEKRMERAKEMEKNKNKEHRRDTSVISEEVQTTLDGSESWKSAPGVESAVQTDVDQHDPSKEKEEKVEKEEDNGAISPANESNHPAAQSPLSQDMLEQSGASSTVPVKVAATPPKLVALSSQMEHHADRRSEHHAAQREQEKSPAPGSTAPTEGQGDIPTIRYTAKLKALKARQEREEEAVRKAMRKPTDKALQLLVDMAVKAAASDQPAQLWRVAAGTEAVAYPSSHRAKSHRFPSPAASQKPKPKNHPSRWHAPPKRQRSQSVPLRLRAPQAENGRQNGRHRNPLHQQPLSATAHRASRRRRPTTTTSTSTTAGYPSALPPTKKDKNPPPSPLRDGKAKAKEVPPPSTPHMQMEQQLEASFLPLQSVPLDALFQQHLRQRIQAMQGQEKEGQPPLQTPHPQSAPGTQVPPPRRNSKEEDQVQRALYFTQPRRRNQWSENQSPSAPAVNVRLGNAAWKKTYGTAIARNLPALEEAILAELLADSADAISSCWSAQSEREGPVEGDGTANDSSDIVGVEDKEKGKEKSLAQSTLTPATAMGEGDKEKEKAKAKAAGAVDDDSIDLALLRMEESSAAVEEIAYRMANRGAAVQGYQPALMFARKKVRLWRQASSVPDAWYERIVSHRDTFRTCRSLSWRGLDVPATMGSGENDNVIDPSVIIAAIGDDLLHEMLTYTAQHTLEACDDFVDELIHVELEPPKPVNVSS